MSTQSRRWFLAAVPALLAAPAIVRATSLMPVKPPPLPGPVRAGSALSVATGRGEWVEVLRDTSSHTIFENPSDPSQFVVVERLERITFRNAAGEQIHFRAGGRHPLLPAQRRPAST